MGKNRCVDYSTVCVCVCVCAAACTLSLDTFLCMCSGLICCLRIRNQLSVFTSLDCRASGRRLFSIAFCRVMLDV